jgi:hypothetical protein
MIEKLPYRLSSDVLATEEGLLVSTWALYLLEKDGPVQCTEKRTNTDVNTNARFWFIRWKDVVEVIRYRDGEPWCAEGDCDEIVCVRGSASAPEYALRRIAAFICDDVEAFRVLHWCVHNLGGKT